MSLEVLMCGWISKQLKRYHVAEAVNYSAEKGWTNNKGKKTGGNFSLLFDSNEVPEALRTAPAIEEETKFPRVSPDWSGFMTLGGRYLLVKASGCEMPRAVAELQVAILRITDYGVGYERLWGEPESIELSTHAAMMAALIARLIARGLAPRAGFHDHNLEDAVLDWRIPVINAADRSRPELCPTPEHDNAVYKEAARGHQTLILYKHGTISVSGVNMVDALKGNLAATGRKLPAELGRLVRDGSRL